MGAGERGMTDIPVRPHRKTLQQTAIILNVTVRTVRRYLEKGLLKWSGNQVSVASIEAFLASEKVEETVDEVDEKIKKECFKKQPLQRRPRSGWVHNF